MADENEFLAIDESLDNIESIVGEIRDTVNKQDESEDDFVSSDKADFYETVKSINTTLESVNSYFQNMGSSKVDNLQEPIEPIEDITNDRISDQLIETTKVDNAMLVDHLTEINDTLKEIKSFNNPENTTNISPEETNKIENINKSSQGIDQEMKTIAELQESISSTNINNQGTDILSELKGVSGVNWQDELIEPLQQLRDIINEPVLKDNITSVLDSLSSKNIDLSKIQELEKILPNITSSLKDFKLDPAAFKDLEEFEENINNIKTVMASNKSSNDFESLEKANNPISQINTIPVTNVSDDMNYIPGQNAMTDTSDFDTETSEINIAKETNTESNLKKTPDVLTLEHNQEAATSDFVVEPHSSQQIMHSENTTDNPLETSNSTNSQMTKLVELVQKQNDLLNSFIQIKTTDPEKDNKPEKPIMEMGSAQSKEAGTTESADDATNIVLQQLVSIMGILNSSISELSSSMMASRNKPIKLN
jgi:hypothetical protein